MAIRLLTPADRTPSDPKLTMEASRLVVDYDCEEDDGRITTGRILFEDILSFQYWDASCCPAQNVVPASEVRVLERSGYLDEIKGRWNESVGWQEWQKEQGGADRFLHFTVYFDDSGSLDVIAARCHVDR